MPIQAAFFHPDLGVGGAEQLVVSAACGLQQLTSRPSVDITIFTGHHDRKHCFRETVDGTLKVDCRGSWIPSHIFGRVRVLCAIIKMTWVVLSVYCSRIWGSLTRGEKLGFDFIVNDQLAAINPLLFPLGRRLLFYCHFPDFLLVTNRSTRLRRAYRGVFDRLEAWATGLADVIFVNSEFTMSVFQKAFPSTYRRKKGAIKVLYPPVDLRKIDAFLASRESSTSGSSPEFQRAMQGLFGCCAEGLTDSAPRNYILSLNRYERKKNVGLALRTLALVKASGSDVRLVVAGGHDPQCAENAEVLEELRVLCKTLGLTCNSDAHNSGTEGVDVLFLCSVSDTLRLELLLDATALVYTPKNEHFGIVPCEAMALGTVPVASNSGGPRESIVDKKTGFLCEDSPSAFAEAVQELLGMKSQDFRRKSETKFPGHGAFRLQKMKLSARRRIEDEFSLKTFAQRLVHAGLGRERT